MIGNVGEEKERPDPDEVPRRLDRFLQAMPGLGSADGKQGIRIMAEKGETTAIRLVRFLALGVPMLSRVVAVTLVAAALALAFFDVGGYDEGARADLALLLSVLALLALALGYAVPRLVARFLPRR